MIIAQISDTHVVLDARDAERRMRDFAQTIADINALDPLPDAIMHTGDVVHNGRDDEYAAAVAILGEARAPVYVLPGNKDDRRKLRSAFAPRGYFTPDYPFIDYAVEDFPVRLIALDTLCDGRNKGEFRQIDTLIRMIDGDTKKPIAVFTHHPPFEVTVGPERIHFETLENMALLGQALQHSGRIAGVFSGHVHRAAFGFVGRIPASVVQCIATTLRKGEYPPAMRRCPVYHIHRFDAAGSVVTETRIVTAAAAAVVAHDPTAASAAAPPVY